MRTSPRPRGCQLDTNFPSCCANQWCCERTECCQPCMFFGDDNWSNLCRGAQICCAFGSFSPRPVCQYFCIKFGDIPDVIATGSNHPDFSSSGAPGGNQMV